MSFLFKQNSSMAQNPHYYVTHTNPEILTVTPRPGGLAKIALPPKRNRLKEHATKLRKAELDVDKLGRSRSGTRKKSTASTGDESVGAGSRKSLLTCTPHLDDPAEMSRDNFPREYKVKQIIAATPWSVEFDEYLDPNLESTIIPDPFQDSVDMLAMTISVIMLMSKGYDKIDPTHLRWVLSYLECIKDDFDQTPPNVQGIINHINKMTGGQIKSFLDHEPDELEPRTTVRISVDPPGELAPAKEPAEPVDAIMVGYDVRSL